MNGIEWLLDTNMVIGLLKGHGPAIALAEQSQITRMELLGYPKLTEQEEQEIRAFLSSCEVWLLSETIEAQAIALRRAGAFKLPDAIVAATAITGQLHLLTLDQGMLNSLHRLGQE